MVAMKWPRCLFEAAPLDVEYFPPDTSSRTKPPSQDLFSNPFLKQKSPSQGSIRRHFRSDPVMVK